MQSRGRTTVLIVAYGNPNEVSACVGALAQMGSAAEFDVIVCENAGETAFSSRCETLVGADGPCESADAGNLTPRVAESTQLPRRRPFTLRGGLSSVLVACARANLGYAGAINAMIELIEPDKSWDAIWVLNPDTHPEQGALRALVDYAEASGKVMIGSTLLNADSRQSVQFRGGMRWSVLTGRGLAVGPGTRESLSATVPEIEARLSCVSGASMYVVRSALRAIGPMDERFFLYFEDLDWGLRARVLGLGYAEKSVVRHRGGTTIGTASVKREGRSWLSIYLQYRNVINFTRKHYPYLVWLSVLTSLMHASRFLAIGSWSSFKIAMDGFGAGLRGEIGPPPQYVSDNIAIPQIRPNKTSLRRIKIAISSVYLLALIARNQLRSLIGLNKHITLTILYYHNVPLNYFFEFRRQIQSLERRTNLMPANFAQPLPDNGRANVALTFDDALVSLLNNAIPQLSEFGATATVFAPVGFLGKLPTWEVDDPNFVAQDNVMTEAELQSLPTHAITIGSHTVSHKDLTAIRPFEVESEIQESRSSLRKILGRDVDTISIPYGRISPSIVSACASAGYKFVFSIEAQNVDTLSDDPERGRTRVDPWDGQFEFYLKSRGAYAWHRKLRKLSQLFASLLSPLSRRRTAHWARQ